MQLRAASEALLKELVETTLHKCWQGLSADEEQSIWRSLRVAHRTLSEQTVLAAFPSSPADARSDVAYWRFAAQVLLVANKPQWRKKVDKRQGFVSTEKAHKKDVEDLLQRLHSVDGLATAFDAARYLPQPIYTEDQWAGVLATMTALRLASAEFTRLMNEAGLYDYPELAASALDTLGDDDSVGDLALQYDYRLQHLLVDEMQDTSARQYRLLERLTAGWQPDDGRTLFCVGDPMQSIYGFRGAEVSLFLRAWEEGIGHVALVPIRLSTNFRSCAPLIDWVNTTFKEVFSEENNPIDEAVAHAQSAAAPSASSEGAVHWHCREGDASEEADYVAAQVQTLLGQPDRTIAIVGRTRHALSPVLDSLERRGVAFESIDMERLTERAEVQDLLALTRALEMPDDDLAWLGCLRAPWCGVSLEALDALMLDSFEGSSAELRKRTAAILNTKLWTRGTHARVCDFLEKFEKAQAMAATQSLRSRVERLWGSLGGPAILQSRSELEAASSFFAAVEELEQSGRLHQPALLEKRLSDRKVSGGVPGARVVVMTIYSSKGLEFDHVLMPGLSVTSQTDSFPPLQVEFGGNSDNPAVVFAASGYRHAEDRDPLTKLLRRLETVRASNELKRLLYVATTRARASLHLFIRAERLSKGTQWKRPTAHTLLSTIWSQALPHLPKLDDMPAVETIPKTKEPIFVPPLHATISEPWKPPLGSTTQSLGVDRVIDADPIDRGDAEARHVGTVVHEWLRALADREAPLSVLNSIDDRKVRTEQWLARLGVSAGQVPSCAARVLETLEVGLDSEAGRWIVGSHHLDNRSEFEVWTNTSGGARRVVVDRVVRRADGELWIIDYKTALPDEAESVEEFIERSRAQYREQLLRYETAVLGLSEFRELNREDVRRGLFLVALGRLVSVR
ncbi:MAG: 3'-5' exonuclease [Pseudomonadota bacterium]